MLLCIRWYLAYNLSLRDLEEMMAERGISLDHATIHRWVVRSSPELLKRFNARKRAVTGKWHVDETYINVRGRWRYLYWAIDSNGDTVEFWFSERRNLATAKRLLLKALKRHGRPERIIIDGSQTNREDILSCDAEGRLQDHSRRRRKPIRIRQSQYLTDVFDKAFSSSMGAFFLSSVGLRQALSPRIERYNLGLIASWLDERLAKPAWGKCAHEAGPYRRVDRQGWFCYIGRARVPPGAKSRA